MSELKTQLKQAENEMDDVIKKRIYGNGATEMTEELRMKMIEIIGKCKDMAISTIRDDGWPQVNTVGFVSMEENIYFETFRTSSKAMNIARDNRISLAIWPYYENVTHGSGISLAGYAEEVTDEETSNECTRLLLEKMPEIKDITYNDGDPVFPDPNVIKFRIRPTVISILDFEKGFGHADFVVLEDGAIK
jgi:uncharacterized pyridoxamine 5'-phosphate oxidase family protein